MNVKELKEMIALMQENGLTELEIEKNGLKLKLKRGTDGVIVSRAIHHEGKEMSQQIQGDRRQESNREEKEPENVEIVRSPMVGTFYASPGPDKEPYVTNGKTIKVGDVLCIVEAMKLMNEIKSETSGRIVEILVTNGQPVEFDQPLFKVQKA